MSLDVLLYLIEAMREKLNKTAVQKSLIDPEVIKLSQIIDTLLNLYHTTLSHPV